MPDELIKIKFYFPDKPEKNTNKQRLVDFVIKEMKKDGGIKYSGYLKEENLKTDLSRYLDRDDFQNITLKDKNNISSTINKIVQNCHQVLPHPNPPIFVFIYPWSPDTKDDLFKGVTAFAEYYTIHLFINLKTYTKESLAQTIAHEWNHLVFYRLHDKFPYSLRTHIIMEGIAEIFREEIVGGKPAPWSLALSKEESLKQYENLKQDLNCEGMEKYREVFFGSKKYKKWTGYSIGYNLVKEFRKKHQKLSWKEIIETENKIINN